MKRNDSSKDKGSNIVLKIGITYIIPIFLAICGLTLVFTDVWKEIFVRCYFSKNYDLDGTDNDTIASYNVNNKSINMPTIETKFATIEILSISLKEDIYQGSYDDIMSLGIGHNTLSKLPGFGENCILRGLNSKQFKNLDKVKKDDEVIITTEYGKYFYKVSDISTVAKDDESFMKKFKHEEKLTMYTDYPFGQMVNTGQKYVVTCDFIRCE